jgi:hypothetical protein
MTTQLANFLLKKLIAAQLVKLFPLLLLNVRINYRPVTVTLLLRDPPVYV